MERSISIFMWTYLEMFVKLMKERRGFRRILQEHIGILRE